MSTNNPYLNRNTVNSATKNNGNVVTTNLGIRPVLDMATNPVSQTEPNSSNFYKQQKQQYQSQSVVTMTQGEMLIKLYEEIIKQINIAIECIDEKPNSSQRNTSLLKSQKIFNHLRMTLNFDYKLAENLNSLYEYFVKCIINANIHDDSKPLNDILPLIIDLKDSYTEAEKSLRNNKK